MLFCQDQEMIKKMKICFPFPKFKILSDSDNASTFISIILNQLIRSCQNLSQ